MGLVVRRCAKHCLFEDQLLSASKQGVSVRIYLHDLADENKDLEGLVIDLRGNAGGGILESGVSVCDLFLEDEVSCSNHECKNRRSFLTEKADSARMEERSPGQNVRRCAYCHVLIDEFTANVSEVVAACLQDHSRATIVGSRSFGNASIQTVYSTFEWSSGAIRLTTNQYQRPSGCSAQ